MIILGITGPIASGKTVVSRCFARLDVPIFDADEEVHRLLESHKPLQHELIKIWPWSVMNGRVDRSRLGERLFFDRDQIFQLESIIYPILGKSLRRFLEINSRHRLPIVGLSVPLLFETEMNKYCDHIIQITTNPILRRNRALRRPHMTIDKLEAIESLFIHERKKKAGFYINTGLCRGQVFREVKKIMLAIEKAPGSSWQVKWPRSIERKLP